MGRLLAFFFLIIFTAACSFDKTPAGIIPADKMVDVLTDIHIADGYTTNLDAYRDSVKIATVYKSFYKKYNTDSIKVRKSLEYYSRSPKKLQEMYRQVEVRLDTLKKQEDRKEQARIKQEEKKQKALEAARKKREKLRKDSLRTDSLKKVTVKRDSLKRDSLKKAGSKKELRKRNDIPAKRN